MYLQTRVNVACVSKMFWSGTRTWGFDPETEKTSTG